MMFKYFSAPFTPEALKNQYKENAKRLHPDMPGGDKIKFQEMQTEFDRVLIFAQKAKPFKRGAPNRKQRRSAGMFTFTQEEKEFLKELRDLASAVVRNKIVDEVKKWNT